jgi:hypothetical protein
MTRILTYARIRWNAMKSDMEPALEPALAKGGKMAKIKHLVKMPVLQP